MGAKRPRFVRIGTALALLFLLVFVLWPLFSMFRTLAGVDVAAVFTARSFSKALRNTLVSGILVTCLSMVLAVCGALLLWRTAVPCKGLWHILLILPMLVPSVSLGNGLVTLFGANGFVTRLFHLPFNIYGMHGIVFGQAVYTTPAAFLLISNILRYEDRLPHEAAIVLGISPLKRFFCLTVPYMRRTLIASSLMIFAMSVTDYGVPFSVGGKLKTLSTIMFSEVACQLNFGKGSVIGLCLLVPAVLVFLADMLQQGSTSVSGRTPWPAESSRKGTVLAFFAILLLALYFFLPIMAFVCVMLVEDYPLSPVFTLSHLQAVFRDAALAGLKNSLCISLGAALLGTGIACAAAYASARHSSPAARAVHLLAMVLQSVPGLVLGLAFILAFKKSPLYGTLGIMILVNTVHFFTMPYLMLYQSFGKLNENLESVGLILGIPTWKVFFCVILPQCTDTLLDMLAYFFVNSMVTISAVSFLAVSATRPLSMLITQYSDQLNIEAAAALSFVILVLNMLVQGLLRRRGKTERKMS